MGSCRWRRKARECDMGERANGGLLSARIVFGTMVVLLVVGVLFTPSGTDREGDPRLSSRSTASQGAQGLADGLQRLGWRVDRREAAFAGVLGIAPEPHVVHAVLDPPTDL